MPKKENEKGYVGNESKHMDIFSLDMKFSFSLFFFRETRGNCEEMERERKRV